MQRKIAVRLYFVADAFAQAKFARRHVAHHGIKNDAAETDKKIAAEMFGDLPSQMNFSIAEQLSGEEIAVIVCDTGRGILPEDIPKLFQKFYRGKKPLADTSTDGTPDDAAGKAETPGVGLGLYFAKRLITALDGRITVNSEVGRESCFTIFLPVWDEKLHEKDTLDEYDFDTNDRYAKIRNGKACVRFFKQAGVTNEQRAGIIGSS